MLVCSPLLQLRVSDRDLTSAPTGAGPTFCFLLLDTCGGDDGMRTLCLGGVC